MPEPIANDGQPWLSVVVPMYNEEENVEPLIEAVRSALPPEGWELLLVDDGSGDATVERIERQARTDERILLVPLARNYGQTQAMQAGFDHARGSVVVTMDGDLQNDPADIPQLVAKLDEGYDLVTGYRERRQDAFVRRKLPSLIANRVIAGVTGVRVRDNGCTLKAYRGDMLRQLHLYSDMHRFLPALAASTAHARIAEIPVRHHPRRFGTSKYGLSRIFKVLADLLVMKMISTFRERPLGMLSVAAVAAMLLGMLAAGRAIVKWSSLSLAAAETYVVPTVAALFLMLALYLVMLGLIGEVVLRRARGPGGPFQWQVRGGDA